ncbi:AAA family ATPase [Desulfobacterales bacterium HSG16]|nr:AAA family ATPase [Desulfobacterales bacterium HSG16]
MKIKSISLTGYRGAQSLTLDLHEKLNVFCGVNGSGKSTILDAVAIMLSWAVSRIRHSSASGRHISAGDITNEKSFAAIELACEYNGQAIDWKLVKSRTGHLASGQKSILITLKEFARKVQEQITSENEQVNLPIFVYYPVNRAVLDIPLRIQKKHSFNLLAAYDEALTSGASFRTFFEWFREREDLENESRKYLDYSQKPEGFQFPDPHLEAVRNAFALVMPKLRNLTVRRNPLRMDIEKDGKWLTVNQLSDGEKCLMAMVGDLARRIAIANPLRKDPLEGSGIVMIDEIDLHLHPKWQRMIIQKLVEVFPNCQFMISTHSPHILTHVQAENLFMLEQTDKGIVSEQPNESYGKNAL